jgi:hypothetical protein
MTTPTATEPTLPILLRVAGQVTRRLTAADLDVADWSLQVDVHPGPRGAHLSFHVLGPRADRLATVATVARALKATVAVHEQKGFSASVPDDHVHLSARVTRGNVVIEIVTVLFSPDACDQARATYPTPTTLAGAA